MNINCYDKLNHLMSSPIKIDIYISISVSLVFFFIYLYLYIYIIFKQPFSFFTFH